MNKRIPLTLESIIADDDSIIDIYEVNSGYQDHKDFPGILNAIIEKIKLKFDKLRQWKIDDLTSSEYIVNHNIGFISNAEDPSSVIDKNIKVIFKSVNPPERLKNKIFVSGETHLENTTFDIKIGINFNKTVGDILDNINILEMVMSHELVHIFQNLYNNHQKTQAYYSKLHKKGQTDGGSIFGNQKYWTSKHEIDAYITQINTELKNIKKEIPDIKFSTALLKTDGWRLMYGNINDTNHLALKRVLGKVVHYWQHTLGGKINEYRIKL
jgi:hypothetical protein